MFSKLVLNATVSTLSLVASGCGNSKSDHQKERHLVVAKENPTPVHQAFNAVNPKSLTASETQGLLNGTLSMSPFNSISLAKKTLGKPFLMTPTVVVASNIPMIDHYEPKLVMFEQAGDSLALYEINFDTVYNDFNANKLLQAFSIESQNNDSVQFRWDYGLEYLATDLPYLASDFGTDGKELDQDSPVIPATKTLVKEISFANNSAFIRQVSRLRKQSLPFNLKRLFGDSPIGIETNDLTVNMTMELTPYTPNKQFTPKRSPMNDGIGYFETLSLKKGKLEPGFNAMRWDIGPGKTPITYAITSSTPTEMVEPMREAILYWNRVLGFEGIRVETGANPESFPQDKRVLVHWIDFEDAGFAKATLQPDPITGEIRRADIYMTSTWDAYAKRNTRAWLSTLADKSSNGSGVLLPSGFTGRNGCTLNYSEFAQHGDLFEELDQNGSDPESPRRVARDMVREVLAHEVGHTLGLRHNFAGSLDSHLESYSATQNLKKQYLADSNHGGAIISNSVMDYFPALETVLLGAKIRTETLSYDKFALDWGYSNLAIPDKMGNPLFCTDALASEGGGAWLRTVRFGTQHP